MCKTTTLRINLNLDGVSITSVSHTNPSHSQTSRLLTSSLSLGFPVPRATGEDVVKVLSHVQDLTKLICSTAKGT